MCTLKDVDLKFWSFIQNIQAKPIYLNKYIISKNYIKLSIRGTQPNTKGTHKTINLYNVQKI